jgi:hypothetical protein
MRLFLPPFTMNSRNDSWRKAIGQDTFHVDGARRETEVL